MEKIPVQFNYFKDTVTVEGEEIPFDDFCKHCENIGASHTLSHLKKMKANLDKVITDNIPPADSHSSTHPIE